MNDPVITLWQPIETAPKDGSFVLAWKPSWTIQWGRARFVRWTWNARTKTEFWNDADELDWYELEMDPPTHWLPITLPALPGSSCDAAPDPAVADDAGHATADHDAPRAPAEPGSSAVRATNAGAQATDPHASS